MLSFGLFLPVIFLPSFASLSIPRPLAFTYARFSLQVFSVASSSNPTTVQVTDLIALKPVPSLQLPVAFLLLATLPFIFAWIIRCLTCAYCKSSVIFAALLSITLGIVTHFYRKDRS